MADEEKQAPAEGTQEAKKKKGGKLPIILSLVILLAGGGFFVMKGRGASATKQPEVPALGAIEPVKEMLVNLAGNQAYLRAEIGLHVVKDFKKEEFEANKEAVTDAIIGRLKSKKLSDIQTPEQMMQLKREIAEDVNKIFNRDKGAKADSPDGAAKTDASPAYKVPDDYDSATGPVLKVYFTSFTTQ